MATKAKEKKQIAEAKAALKEGKIRICRFCGATDDDYLHGGGFPLASDNLCVNPSCQKADAEEAEKAKAAGETASILPDDKNGITAIETEPAYDELLDKLEKCGFTCEGGELVNAIEWQSLRTLLQDYEPKRPEPAKPSLDIMFTGLLKKYTVQPGESRDNQILLATVECPLGAWDRTKLPDFARLAGGQIINIKFIDPMPELPLKISKPEAQASLPLDEVTAPAQEEKPVEVASEGETEKTQTSPSVDGPLPE